MITIADLCVLRNNKRRVSNIVGFYDLVHGKWWFTSENDGES